MTKSSDDRSKTDVPRPELDSMIGQMLDRVQHGKTLRPVGTHTLPQAGAAHEIISLLRQILFFGYLGLQDLKPEKIKPHMTQLMHQAFDLLSRQIARAFRHDCKNEHVPCDQCRSRGERETHLLIAKLPDIRDRLEEDVQAAFDGDPAAKNYDEIVFSYPGLYAITVHRISHELYLQGVPLLPRLLSETAHSETGIDIHPGAQLGRWFLIDHGTGVVIGETTVIGDHVKIYQGATLGALSFPSDACGALIRGVKRHPTLEDHVTVYAGATILGGETVIGAGSVIGGSVWLTTSVPPGTKVILESPRLKYKNSDITVKAKYVPDFQI